MHRIAPLPGGFIPGDPSAGVIIVEQTPAPIVFLTAADTDIQVLAQAVSQLSPNFPALRVVNLLQLQQPFTIDTYAEDVLEQAQVIILRLLGGRSYWSYGLEVVKDLVQRTGAALFVLPGDDRPDPDLLSHSTVSLQAVHTLWRYFTEGGADNTRAALQFVGHHCLGHPELPSSPQAVPKVGLYPWQTYPPLPTSAPRVGLLFYRAHFLAGNTAPVDALCTALAQQQLQPVPVFIHSLREADLATELLRYFQPDHAPTIEVLLNTTSFSLAKLTETAPELELWQQLDVPVLQVICSGGTVEQWQSQFQGLSPRDMAMNVALPEVDGRIISRAVSFKAVQARHPQLETEVVTYEPVADRIQFVADLAAHWVQLRQTPTIDRRVALILANYPSRDGRLANGVGLDTPASCVAILQALVQAGYEVKNEPMSSEELIQRLTAGSTNDSEGQDLRRIEAWLSLADYERYFAALPVAVRQGVVERWGSPQEAVSAHGFAIAGLRLGNVFVGIQPARGYDLDPSFNYHAPDLEPPHAYLAFYFWVRHCFGAQVVVHVGKHGNLEWLPGKSIALAETCYPEAVFGPLPHLYPFIVNDPGEGAQAKRRAQAVILDHLTPPLTRAELYGPLQQLEGLIDEYYEAQSLDPTRLPLIGDRITALVQQEHLHRDLGIELELAPPQLADFLSRADGYLCELKEAQIRDGLHIFGSCPQGRQLRDLTVALARHPGLGHRGLTRSLAEDWGLDFDPLSVDPVQPCAGIVVQGQPTSSRFRIAGDWIAALEEEAATLVEQLIANRWPSVGEATAQELLWIREVLLPRLRQTDQEIFNLLRGLEGRYVPSGPSGAPTRGRPEVLPTGRNFYAVDIRAVPTETAWQVGRQAAEALIERYTQDQGEYPRTLALSVWGTATMRTGGDDLAEALALLGVQPVWEGLSRRVVDFEILPLAVLGRPRVDVTLRISGFFRDAFSNLIDLFDQAVAAVAALDEPPDQNPLAAQVRQETARWQAAGLTPEQALQRSRYRIFGSKPGAYGAGLQGLIEAQNWTDDQDLARAYINWSSYAYTGQGEGRAAPEAFEQRLQTLEVVLHNQDNREHDLLDSDDYYQFQGGLTAAIRAVTGRNPQTYFGDHAVPHNPRVRRLSEEITRVYRSRVVNPKWIEGAMRHGYKGAFEMAATVDYLFAYDATAHCVEDHMYAGIAAAYLLDPTVQAFVQSVNPWALRDMSERLLEAHQRGLWSSAPAELLEDLRSLVHQAEAVIEAKSDPH